MIGDLSLMCPEVVQELDENHTIQTLGSLGSVLLVTIKQELLSKSLQTVVWTIVDFLESSRGGESYSQLIYRPDNGEILGVHIFGLHAADLIHEASNAIALGTRIQDVKFAVHAHTTLSEVLDKLFKSAKVQPVREHSGRASAVELVQAVNEILSAAAIKMDVEKQVLLQEQ